jgi:pimeloyl-ACP methyl ester carboxylesterase
MQAPTAKPFTVARIFALAVIAVALFGLAYLHLGSGTDSVSVPAGAHAGQLALHSCSYGTEKGGYAADCGTLVARENRHRTDSRLIALPVTRIRARSSNPGLPIFRLQGGPGLSNMSFKAASRFADEHDVVLVGYRGVDGSSRLDCNEVAAARDRSRDLLSDRSYRQVAAAFKDCAQRLGRAGVDVGGYTLPERLDDFDAVRRALGYGQIDLLSESAGTRSAMAYAWRYPNRVHRSVMIGVNPPGNYLWDAKTTGEQIRRYAALCAKDEACSRRTPDLTAALHSAYRHLPGHWWFLPIKKGDARAAAFFGLMNETNDGGGPIPAPRTIDALLSAGQGDGSGAWFLSLMAQLAFPRAQVWGDVAAVARNDAAVARRFFARHADRGSVIGSPGTDLIWAGGRLLNAWPASPDENEYTHVQNSKAKTLLIGGALDFATPPQNARRELLPHLPNGHQVVLPGLGHTDDFWAYERPASNRLVNTYFDSGRVDTSLYTRNRVDFTPGFSHGAIAKILLAVMLAFTTLTVLSLIWLPLHVRHHERFGRKASGAVRSVYALLLGLGGWFAGILIALTALPAVPLDDELLAALSVGVPVGLVIYFAWVNRDWATDIKVSGFAAAAAGALVGSWLGFNAIEGLFALVTAMVGATVGGNLIVLVVDTAWDRQARDRFPAPSLREALEPRPSLLPE